jgi:hypothetical protein
MIEEVVVRAATLSSLAGIARVEAVRIGARVRIREEGLRRSRGVKLADLPHVETWGARPDFTSHHELVEDLAEALDWDVQQCGEVEAAIGAVVNGGCTIHGTSRCLACLRRRYSRGHYLVEAVALVITHGFGIEIEEAEMDRAVRMASDKSLVPAWAVGARISRWEGQRGLAVLR